MSDSTNFLQTYTPNSDVAAGFNLSQIIYGRVGNDTFLGLQPLTPSPGQTQNDLFLGDLAIEDPTYRQWSDTFILGDSTQAYYDNGNPQTFGLNDFASIVDFNPAQDFIQLHGTSNDYQLVNLGFGEALLQQNETGLDVIGFFLGNSNLSLGGDYFLYQGYTPPETALPQIQQLGSSGFDLTPTTATDPSGNVYIAGGTTGSLAGDNAGLRDALVTKYDSLGNVLWTKQFGTSSTDMIYGIATDKQGNFYVAGFTEGDLASPKQAVVSDSWVAKYDSNGNQQWIQQFGEASISEAFSIDVDDNSNVYLSGITVKPSAEIATDDSWVIKYDTNGNRQWFTEYGTPAFDETYAVAVSNDGSVYSGGWTLGDLGGENAGLYDAALAKLNNNGEVEWTRQLGTPDYEWMWGVDTDSQGNVYATGWTLGDLGGENAGSYDVFLTKYDSQGNQQWIKQFGTAGDDEAFRLNIDSNDNIFLTGYTDNSLGGSNAGSYDAWVAKYDTNGNQGWITQFGTPELDHGLGITSDNAGNVYVTGLTGGSLGATNAGSFDSWLAKLDGASGTLQDFSGTPNSVDASPALNLLGSDTGNAQLTNQVSDTGDSQLPDQQIVDFIGNYLQEFTQANNLQLYAQAGNDLLSAIYGNDVISGGHDTIDGSCGNDTLYGENDNNTIYGKAGDDILYGGEGNNKLYGDDGNDTLYGGTGNNTLDGGEGNDLIYARQGQNTVLAGAGNNKMYTGLGNDIINTGDGNNLIYAGKGKNTITTGAGNDTIYAGAGNDTIYAGAGDDFIYAGRGDNILYGGTGNDTLSSGRGRDVFVLTPGEGASTIIKFDISKDLLGLTEGLTYEELSITQGTNGGEFFTQISVANSNDLLATLNWVEADTITSSSFTFV